VSHLALAFAAAVVLLPVGSSAAPLPTHLMPPDLPFTFPTRAGTSWDYREGRDRWHVGVVRVTERDGAKVLSRSMKSGMCGSPTGNLVVSADRVTEAAPGSRAASRTLLVLPLRVGATWEDQGWAATVCGSERVTVPAGDYHAIRVEEVMRVTDGEVTVTSWYASGVGLVKRVRKSVLGGESVRVLYQFRPGRE
jgi:hypothetical protein